MKYIVTDDEAKAIWNELAERCGISQEELECGHYRRVFRIVLYEALREEYSLRCLAKIMGIHRTTVYHYQKQLKTIRAFPKAYKEEVQYLMKAGLW